MLELADDLASQHLGRMQHLDRDRSVRLDVARAIHHPRRAFTNDHLDAITIADDSPDEVAGLDGLRQLGAV